MKKIFWVERLGFVEVITFLLQGFFFDIIIRYDEHQASTSGISILRLLKKFGLCGNFYPVSLSLNAQDEDGYSMAYRMEENLDSCLEGFCKGYIPDEQDWFKRMIKSYVASDLLYQITFITMVESEIEHSENQKNVLYIVRHPLSSLVIPFYANRGWVIKRSFGFGENIKFIIRPLYLIFAILIGKLFPYKVKTNISHIRPAVWVEYSHNDTANMVFWNKSGEQSDFDLVCYLDREDTPPAKEITGEIEKRGLKWIDAHFISLIRLCKFHYSDLRDLMRELLSLPRRSPLWFRIFRFEERVFFLLYRSAFNAFQVKVLIQHQDCSWRQDIQARAIESAGGIMVGFHWSNFLYYLEPKHLTPQHVYFVWGKAIFEWLQKKGNTCRYALPSGLWIMPDKKEPRQLHALMDDLNFIIAIFDSSVSYNIHQSPDTLSQFYLMAVRLLEDNPSWGGIIKSKNWNLSDFSFLPQGQKIVARMKALIEQKRLVVLNRTVCPVTAAVLADLSICYGLNTAGILAGVHGHNTIHWDCSGWRKHPFYKEQGQRFLFLSLEEFEEAIVKASKGDKEIGDFTRWSRRFNHFNDFSAPERVGKFIRSFMKNVVETSDPMLSLDSAVQRYIEENGIGSDFFMLENWWE